eukprot:CAMPEP_0116134816 /NCGR_PEP_ID=MMETSP0329-20121206/10853_1 /TAXON_ID=697910 /ORGANISM="Pseudo-nitzschia arenysensis, Strain B593" /LENGTH=357 /DNA_ID=CAMNT_0003629563 /DNA_START=155 /DNA_END=1228 /DNA_ORIENTATION=-
MFMKKLKGKYAKEVAKQVEEMTLNVLNEVNPQAKTEEATTESLHLINGRRKALFIGINYVGQKGELRGCVNDVVNIKEFFEKHYPLDDKMILTDDKRAEPETNFAPTKKNILSAFRWLVRGAKKGDSLLLHYSGHGGKVKNKDGTEKSGYDQTVVPVDHRTAGQIVDDEVHDVLCKDLPEGVRLTAIFDCCHSESIMDLPYIYNVNGKLEIEERSKNEMIAQLVSGGTRLFLDRKNKKAMMNFGKDIMGIVQDNMGGKDGRSDDAKAQHMDENTTDADIIMFSGCKDMQTSADANIKGEATGAMSYALIKTLKRHLREEITYTDLLKEMRQVLEGKYTQVPMLSAGRKLKLDSPFMI